MMREYELTDEEYRHVIDALEHAEDQAVSSASVAAFSTTKYELASQREEMVEDE